MHPLHIGFTPNFDRERYLYHYTSMRTAIDCILKNKTIKFNNLLNVNDPMEANPNLILSNVNNDCTANNWNEELGQFFAQKIKISCFSQDLQGEWADGCCPMDICSRGHSKPRMWATYGNNNTGACLIFDKELLKKEFENGLHDYISFLHGPVKYHDQKPNKGAAWHFDYKRLENDFESYVNQKIQDHGHLYFFSKHIDWFAENEYRFVIVSNENEPILLNIGDALVGVTVGEKSIENEDSISKIAKLTQEMNVPCCYMKWRWNSASKAPINEVAKEIGKRY